MPDTAKSLRVDIVSDVVCPWCAIGYHQLKRAAENRGVTLDVHWHPFELNPDMPAEGENLRSHLAAKYGTTPEQSIVARKRLTDMGTDLGFGFNYFDDMRILNTFKAHQLLDWAEAQGKQHPLKLALFQAFFTDQRDVSDAETLVDIAVSCGLDGTAVRSVLDSGERAESVRARQKAWIDLGVRGVPALLFEGKHFVPGAAGIENFEKLLAEIAA